MTKLNKRILSALLAVVLLLTNFPVVSAASDGFAITYEGKTVSQVEFFEHEKITVSAQGNPGSGYQWQIQIPGTEQWVNIQGQTGQTINLSKAVVGSLMVDGSAHVRCAAISDGQEIDHTAALCTTVKKEEYAPQISTPPVTAESAAKPAPAPAEPPAEETEAPVEATEVPVESIPEATEVTIEATAAPTEPAVENEPAPEVVEPSEVPVETTEIPEEIVEIPAETAASTEPEAEVVVAAPAEAPTEEPAAVPEIPAETAAPVEMEAEVVVTAPAENSAKPAEAPTEEPAAVPEIPAETAASTEPEAEFVPVEDSAFEATEAPTEPVVEKSEETFIKKVAQLFTPRASADDPDVDSGTEIVSVTIEYYYQDRLGNKGEMVMDPYVARIKKGDPLNVTVACKAFPGYQILLMGSPAGITLNSRNELEVSLSNVTENRTYEVRYQEVMVKYYARFFLQNAYNDLYTERTNVLTQDQIDQMIGYAGEQPNESLIHPDIDGFSALFHQPDMIAADGSTVFEVYYDRNYYLINFDLNGGFGTAPVYARYETSFTVATPTRPGYSFAGWELVSGEVPADAEVDANGLVKKMPASNMTYRAKWTTERTTYTVVYWRENANDSGYSYWNSVTKTATSGSTVSGGNTATADGLSETAYFTYNDYLTDKQVIVEGDGSSVVNVYYTRNYYTVQFKGYGKCAIPVNHAHTDSCYGYLCFGETHTHTAACLDCKLSEHTHSEECCTIDSDHTHKSSCCVLTPHTTHSAACCELTVHSAGDHVVSCFSGVGDPYNGRPNYAPQNPENGQVYRRYYNSQRYIYIKGTWYEFDGNVNSGSIAPTTCHTHGDGKCTCSNAHIHGDGKCSYSCGEHSHGDGGCTCDKLAHQHFKTCYNCGKTEHTHTDACSSRLICKLPTNHTHTSTCNSNNTSNVIYILTAKYEQDIGDLWPTYDVLLKTDTAYKNSAGAVTNSSSTTDTNNKFQGWNLGDGGSEAVSKKVTMTEDLCNTNGTVKTATATYGARYTYRLYYLFESFDKTSGESGDTRKRYNGVYYDSDKRYYQELMYSSNNATFSQKQITGMTAAGVDDENRNENGTQVRYMFLYYNRNDSALKFQNIDTIVKTINDILYETPMSQVVDSQQMLVSDFEPDYPDTLEPNAYYFDGWYTTPECYSGTEYDFSSKKMPNGDLVLYAKWSPVTYDVYFYMDYSRLQNGTAFQSVKDTAHGEKMITSGVDLTPTHDKDHTYQFVGWFYLDSEGNKTAFNPAEMAVRQELHLYAEWSTMTVKEYAVSYAQGRWDEATKTVIPMEGSEYRALSKDTTGYAFEASTRTFTAKPENQLEELSSEEMLGSIWVPHTNSHSILMQADNDDNVFTFWYVPRANIPYRVRYLDAATGQPVIVDGSPKPDKVEDPNTDAVVTEQFVYVPGYIPDAFYKTLVLSADDSENVINFYYTKDSGVDEDEDTPDTPSARYLVTHYIQNIGSDDYSVYTTDDLIGEIGSEVKAEVLSIPGFAFEHATPKVKTESGKQYAYGTVTSGEDAATALKLELYYNRIKYRYTVEYLDADTLQPIPGVDTKVTAAIYDFDSVVTETTPQNIPGYDLYGSETQTLKISAIEELNKITFLYKPKPLTVNYVPICKTSKLTDFGYVLVTSEYKDIKGTTAVARPAFKFMGWYSDEDCQTKVADKEFYKPDVSTDGGVYDYTFYALFEPIDLKVIYNTNDGDPIDPVTSHIGETVTLPTANRTGYTLLGWWYDADGDGAIDEGEEYAAGSEFTMPAKDVTFVAQWIDSRLAPSLNVYVGINMSFYMTSSGELYYNIPDNEPRQIHNLAAARAYYLENDRNTWYIQDWAWDAELPGKPTDYITESVLTDGESKNGIFGIANDGGLKDYLKFESGDYQSIVKVWLKECRNTDGVLRKNYSSANIDWEKLPNDPSKYEVVPYVIKLHVDAHPDVAGTEVNAWHIDMIIRPAKRCKVSYLDGLDVSYTGSPVTDDHEYGEGFIIQLADAPVATRVDGNTNCYAEFLGWYYDADNSGTIEEAEKTTLYKPGDKFTVPALTNNGQVIQFIGQWDYYAYLTIFQTRMRDGKNESGIYEVVNSSNAVIATVMITGNNSVTLEQVPVDTYTVREITGDWTWTYNASPDNSLTVEVKTNPDADDNKVTFGQVAISPIDWLHSENRR